MNFDDIDKIKKSIEEDLVQHDSFVNKFNTYYECVFALFDGFITINKESVKQNYINEISCLSILRVVIEKTYNNPNLDAKIVQLDDDKHFVWFNISSDKVAELMPHTEIDGDFVSFFYQRYQLASDKRLLGQYYTPSQIVKKIFELSSMESDECLLSKKMLDPACGSGVFFIELVRLLYRRGMRVSEICEYINSNVYGYDINPFALFLTKLSITLELVKLFKATDISSSFISNLNFDKGFKTCNSLQMALEDKMDYILGNPPYFKLPKGCTLYKSFSDITFGQANIYSLFLVWAKNNVKPGGIVSFIVPQSFRSGMYFKQLREVLYRTTILSLYFIDSKDRRLVFKDAEQAVLIITYQNVESNNSKVSIIRTKNLCSVTSYKIPQREIFSKQNFLMLTVSKDSHDLINKIMENSISLKDFNSNLCFGNGLFVWNQNKNYLCENRGLPIIYSNYITPFYLCFNPSTNNSVSPSKRKPYATRIGCEGFVISGKRLITNRTSGMESFTRIRACILDPKDIDSEHFFLENHVNFLYNRNNKHQQLEMDDLLFLCAIFNSDIINFVFKCRNGNTQVSASELNSLPLPKNGYEKIVAIMKEKSLNIELLNSTIAQCYGLSMNEIIILSDFKREYL